MRLLTRFRYIPDKDLTFFSCHKDTYVVNRIVDYFECRLLVVMIHPAVAVEYGHAFVFGALTVAAVHAVVRPVVPLARKDVETL